MLANESSDTNTLNEIKRTENARLDRRRNPPRDGQMAAEGAVANGMGWG